MITSFASLIEYVATLPARSVAIAGAESEVAISAVTMLSRAAGLVPILVGDREKIAALTDQPWCVVHAPDASTAAILAVQEVKEGRADMVAKGACATSVFMKACLDKERGLHQGKLMAQVFAFETPTSNGIKLMSDAAINIKPDVEARAAMIENALPLARALGSERPRVALLGALERPVSSMPDTLESAEIAAQSGRWDDLNCDVLGPLSIDCAVDPESARTKGLKGPVPGRAEILIFPELASANIFAKGLAFLGNAKSGAVVLGGRAPIVLRSRADTVEEKIASIALGILACES